jgi:hypothetical protein
MKYGIFLALLSFISVLCLSACLDGGNNTISQNTTIIDSESTNTTNINTNISNLDNKNNNKNNLNLNDTNVMLNINQTTIEHNEYNVIKYKIIKYGKFGEKNDKFFYSYVNKSENKTTIMIFAGKKPVDCDIHITKIIKINSNSIKVYINESVKNNDIIITSPYIVVEVDGVYDNVEYN